MSKANSPVKVLRTALKRVQKAWVKGTILTKTEEKTPEGKAVYGVCLLGAIGYGRNNATDVQRNARMILEQVASEEYPDLWTNSIPSLNDHHLDQTQAEELLKKAIIRAETGGILDPNEFSANSEGTVSLF